MIVDVHAHYIPKNLGAFIGDWFLPRVVVPVGTGIACHPLSDSLNDISGRFELMEAAGVEKQVLSPHWPPHLPDERECVRAAQMLNDGYADLARRYPDAPNATFAYIERLALPRADVDKILLHNAQALFGYSH